MDRINYHHLYLFWSVAREGSFTKAAEKLRISQSAVTAQIQSLEAFLDTQLFDRSNRRKPILSEEGKRVLNYADPIFETGDELLKLLRNQGVGAVERLRVGALSGLSRNFQYEFLSPLNSLSDVALEVVTGDQEKLVRLLRDNSLELILSSHNVQHDGKAQFHSHVLASSPVVFVTSASARIKGGDLSAHLKARPLFIPGRSFEARPELDAFLNRQRPTPRVNGEIDDVALLRIFALKSKGVVAIPELGVRNDISAGDIKIIARPAGIEQRFYAISRQRRFNSPRVQDLVERMKSQKRTRT